MWGSVCCTAPMTECEEVDCAPFCAFSSLQYLVCTAILLIVLAMQWYVHLLLLSLLGSRQLLIQGFHKRHASLARLLFWAATQCEC